MTDEQINIKIAEACGWSIYLDTKPGHGINHVAQHDEQEPLPDYCNDLNAMHEAEESLEPLIQRKKFPEYLAQVMSAKEGFRTNGLPLPPWWSVHVPARQRAEAFLRTIGKWEGV